MACIDVEGDIVGMGGFEIGTSHKGINAMQMKKIINIVSAVVGFISSTNG